MGSSGRVEPENRYCFDRGLHGWTGLEWMFPAGMSPHLAGVWQCKAKSLLLRAIAEIRGSNSRCQGELVYIGPSGFSPVDTLQRRGNRPGGPTDDSPARERWVPSAHAQPDPAGATETLRPWPPPVLPSCPSWASQSRHLASIPSPVTSPPLPRGGVAAFLHWKVFLLSPRWGW